MWAKAAPLLIARAFSMHYLYPGVLRGIEGALFQILSNDKKLKLCSDKSGATEDGRIGIQDQNHFQFMFGLSSCEQPKLSK